MRQVNASHYVNSKIVFCTCAEYNFKNIIRNWQFNWPFGLSSVSERFCCRRRRMKELHVESNEKIFFCIQNYSVFIGDISIYVFNYSAVFYKNIYTWRFFSQITYLGFCTLFVYNGTKQYYCKIPLIEVLLTLRKFSFDGS